MRYVYVYEWASKAHVNENYSGSLLKIYSYRPHLKKLTQ